MMPARVPRIYLDTNVLLDLFFQRRDESTSLINLAINQRWDVTSSHFALMEMIDIVQGTLWAQRRLNEDREQLNTVIAGRRQRDLSEDALNRIRQQIRRFTDSRYPQIGYFDFASPGILERAMGLCEVTNMTAPDCIHVEMAREIGVDLLVTSDSHVNREAEPWVATSRPGGAVTRLKEMEFDIPIT